MSIFTFKSIVLIGLKKRLPTLWLAEHYLKLIKYCELTVAGEGPEPSTSGL